MKSLIVPFSKISMDDLARVGGKNASLGEMIRNLSPLGVSIPDGFAITVDAFYKFLAFNTISPLIQGSLDRINRLTLENLSEAGACCRKLIIEGIFPDDVSRAIKRAYSELMEKHGLNPSVAVRSSATAEDSRTASFAGQHDSFLNINGSNHVLEAVKQCYASLFNDSNQIPN